jgi:hypothetical protein
MTVILVAKDQSGLKSIRGTGTFPNYLYLENTRDGSADLNNCTVHTFLSIGAMWERLEKLNAVVKQQQQAKKTTALYTNVTISHGLSGVTHSYSIILKSILWMEAVIRTEIIM